jgi:hypothetical protein
MTGKPFEDLTDVELSELRERDWSAAEIIQAIGLALEARDMPAVVALMRRLAVKDPVSAGALLAVIEATR